MTGFVARMNLSGNAYMRFNKKCGEEKYLQRHFSPPQRKLPDLIFISSRSHSYFPCDTPEDPLLHKKIRTL